MNMRKVTLAVIVIITIVLILVVIILLNKEQIPPKSIISNISAAPWDFDGKEISIQIKDIDYIGLGGMKNEGIDCKKRFAYGISDGFNNSILFSDENLSLGVPTLITINVNSYTTCSKYNDNFFTSIAECEIYYSESDRNWSHWQYNLEYLGEILND